MNYRIVPIFYRYIPDKWEVQKQISFFWTWNKWECYDRYQTLDGAKECVAHLSLPIVYSP